MGRSVSSLSFSMRQAAEGSTSSSSRRTCRILGGTTGGDKWGTMGGRLWG